MAEKFILQQQLERELSILQELNELSLRKKDALFRDDFDLLEIIVLKEEALSISLKKIDDACSPQVQFFLKGPINQNEGQNSTEISEVILQIRKMVQKLKLNNDFNQAFIKDCLGIVQFTINSFLPLDNDASLYGSSGKMLRHKKDTFVLDYKG